MTINITTTNISAYSTIAINNFVVANNITSIPDSYRVQPFSLEADRMLDSFIEFCSEHTNITKDEFLNLPLKSFIAFIICEASVTQGFDVSNEKTMITNELQKLNRCLRTGKFINKKAWDKGIRFTSPEAMQCYMEEHSL